MVTWWKENHGEYKFFDADRDPDYNVLGPKLMHFRTATVQDVYEQSLKKWENVIEQKIILPSPYIRLFKDGLYDGRRYFPHCNDQPECEAGTQLDTSTDTCNTSPMEHEGTPCILDQMDCQQEQQHACTSASYLHTEQHISTESTLDPNPTSLHVQYTHQLSPRNL